MSTNLIVMKDDNLHLLSVQELLREGQVLGIEQVMETFMCKRDKAYCIIRAVLDVSNIFNLTGKFHIVDYKIYVDTMVSRGMGYAEPLTRNWKGGGKWNLGN